jgi:hypothetical protein
MIPYGLTREQFAKRYRNWLDNASPQLIAGLHTLFDSRPLSTVTSAEVQIFLGADGRQDPSAWIYFDGMNKKVDNNDPSIFPGRALEFQLRLGRMLDFDNRYFDDDQFPGVDLQANTLKRWFAECWWKAGGWKYEVPSEIAIHDDLGDGERIILTERRPR